MWWKNSYVNTHGGTTTQNVTVNKIQLYRQRQKGLQKTVKPSSNIAELTLHPFKRSGRRYKNPFATSWSLTTASQSWKWISEPLSYGNISPWHRVHCIDTWRTWVQIFCWNSLKTNNYFYKFHKVHQLNNFDKQAWIVRSQSGRYRTYPTRCV